MNSIDELSHHQQNVSNFVQMAPRELPGYHDKASDLSDDE